MAKADTSWEHESAEEEATESHTSDTGLTGPQSHSENETAVDDQQNDENGLMLYKIDTKVSFKSRGPQLVFSFEIKWVKSQSNYPKLHDEFFSK